MKILEFSRSYYPSIGGLEKFVSDRLKIYDRLGYKYKLVTTNHTEKRLEDKKIVGVDYLKSYSPYEFIPFLKSKIENDYDIVSINQTGYYFSERLVEIAFKLGKKVVLTPHFYFHTKKYHLLKKYHFTNRLPKLLNKVDKMVCFTNFEAEYWIENFHWLDSKIVVIPHYFEATNYFNNNSELLIKEPYILFIGRGKCNKRLDLLLKAFNDITTKTKLILTVEYDELDKEYLEIIKTNPNIITLGRVSEEKKHNLLSNCLALILPTDYEAFGIVNLEASYYKKPILLSKLKVLEEILDQKGIVYFNNTVDDIKFTIKGFLDIENEKKLEMGKHNYRNLSKFSFDSVCKSYQDLFDLLRV